MLKGDIQKRCREMVIQICDVEEVEILKGGVSKDHVQIHLEYPPRTSINQLSETNKWAHVENDSEKISSIKENILVQPFLGDWLWSLDYREYNR